LGEWQKYEDIDFDQSLLAKAYQAASKELKAQIGEKSRVAGRIELIKILTSTKRGFNAEKMTEKDWKTFIDILGVQPDRKEIWRFLYNAPPIWSKKLLDKLAKASYKWFRQDEEIIVKKLFALSENSKEEDFALIPYLLIQESQHITLAENIDRDSSSRRTWTLYFSPDSSILFGLLGQNEDKKRKIWLWSLPDGNLLKTIQNISSESHFFIPEIGILAVSPDSKILVSSGGDYRSTEINLWSLPTGNHIRTLKVKVPPSVSPGNRHSKTSLAISPDGRILTSRSYFGGSSGCYDENGQQKESAKRVPKETTIDIWSLPSGDYLRSIPSPIDLIPVRWGSSELEFFLDFSTPSTFFQGFHMVISPDSRFLVSGSGHGKIGLWNLSNGNHAIFTQDTSLSYKFGYGFYTIKPISPNGHILAASYSYSDHLKTFDLWSFPDGNHFKTLLNCTDIAISHDSRILVSAHDDKSFPRYGLPKQIRKEMTELSDYPIHLWSLANGSLIKTLALSATSGIEGPGLGLQISPDNRILTSVIFGSAKKSLCLWNLPDGNLLKTMSNFSIRSAQISPDGNILVGTTDEHTIKLWNLPHRNSNIPISKFTNQDIAEISSKVNDPAIEESFRNTLKFILALIDLRQQFDIDIEDSSNDIPSSEYDIEIE
jgi:WD40 repeat protein